MRPRQAPHLPLEEDVWEGVVVEAVSPQHEGFDEHGRGAVVVQARLFIGGHGQQLELNMEKGEPAAGHWNDANLQALQSVSEVILAAPCHRKRQAEPVVPPVKCCLTHLSLFLAWFLRLDNFSTTYFIH